MRKQVIAAVQQDTSPPDQDWFSMDSFAEVEITSEDATHPIDSALLPGDGTGWRAAVPGEQTIRLLFAHPQRLRRIRLHFVEPLAERTQEYARSCGSNGTSALKG